MKLRVSYVYRSCITKMWAAIIVPPRKCALADIVVAFDTLNNKRNCKL